MLLSFIVLLEKNLFLSSLYMKSALYPMERISGNQHLIAASNFFFCFGNLAYFSKVSTHQK